jgi:flavin reductase (DIM6/NTAB) family NADH-FMN oxidoreductase RutF
MKGSFPRFTSQLDYSMFVVTASDGRRRSGCLVGFSMQCSISPARFLVGISNKNHTYRVIQNATIAIVHLVPEGAFDVAELFGGFTGDEIDKLARTEWREGPGGAPILSRCPSWFAARIEERWDTGDHVTLLLVPFEVSTPIKVSPLMFARAQHITPGHEA